MINNRNAIFLLSLITLIFFLPTLWNGFQIDWDDGPYIIENPYIFNPTLQRIKILFTSSYLSQYAPLNTLYYLLIKSVFGFNPFVYHLMNLIIHIINVILVYKIIKKILSLIKAGYTEERLIILGFLTSLIFAIHPLQVESVAWISASKIPIYSLFYFIGILFYLNYLKTEKKYFIYLILLSILISFGFKEQGITLPIALICIDIVLGRVNFKLFSIWNILIKEKIPFYILGIGLWYFSAQLGIGNFSEDAFPFYQRIIFGAQSLSEYIFRFLAPVKMYYFYYYPMDKGEDLPLLNFGYLLIALIILIYFISVIRRKNRILMFGFLFFISNIFIVLHLIPMPRTFMTADRYMYVAIIGLSLMATFYLQYLYYKYWSHRKKIIILGIILFSLIGIRTFTRSMDWKDSKHLKQNLHENSHEIS